MAATDWAGEYRQQHENTITDNMLRQRHVNTSQITILSPIIYDLPLFRSFYPSNICSQQ
jgi:hypothetical protein